MSYIKGIMCSEFKVILALLFLSSVLRRFFSLDKDLGKKKERGMALAQFML